MSNLIKSRFVYLNNEDRKVIDSNDRRIESYFTKFQSNETEEGFNELSATQEELQDGFVEGIKATVINTVDMEDENTVLQQETETITSDEILQNAKEQAEVIMKEAETEAKALSQKIYDDAKTRGYADGLKKGTQEADLMKQELIHLKQTQENEMAEFVAEIEPQVADVMASLIRNITGILVEDKKSVILHLIHNTLLNADSSKYYFIRVSNEDYDYVLSKKSELVNIVNAGIEIDIIMDKSLSKNQCMIETETGIIDCSLDVEIKGLIQDIKCLAIHNR